MLCKFRRAPPSLAVLAVAVLGAASCSESGPLKVPTSGKVSYRGKPVARGQIQFIPAAGPSVQAPITNGEYRVDYKGGVAVGESRVEIESFVVTGKKSKQPEIARFEDGSEQVIPKKYNLESTLKVTITPGGPNVQHFALPE